MSNQSSDPFSSPSSKVFNLTEKDFKGQVIINKKLSNGICNIMFFANWCPHCIVAKPIYDKVSRIKMGNSENPNVYFAVIDCTNNSPFNDKLKNSLQIAGYPTIVQYNNGKYSRAYEFKISEIPLLKFVVGTENYTS